MGYILGGRLDYGTVAHINLLKRVKELLLLAANSELCLYSQITAKTDIQVVSILETQILTILSGIQVTTDRVWGVSGRDHVMDQLFGVTHLKIPTRGYVLERRVYSGRVAHNC